MTKGMTTGTNVGPHPLTPETDIHGETSITGADETVVAPPATKMMITIRVPILRTRVIPEVAPIVTNATSLIAGAVPLIIRSRRM